VSYKALLIGCGNIGAGYDFDTDAVLTHAKAYSLDSDFTFDVYDRDEALAAKVASKYWVERLDEVSDSVLSQYDIVSICTPTATHFDYLSRAINLGIPLVICEKPVAYDEEELKKITGIYNSGKTKVLVNYIRRFQPGFISLKEIVKKIQAEETLTNVAIRYQRGFVNNASHAFDLVGFLTGKEIKLENIHTTNKITDAFPTDATLTLTANWAGTNFVAVGLSNVKFSLFEIDLFFEYHKISIRDAGNIIEVYKAEKGETFFKPLERQSIETSCLKDYMKPVMDAAKRMLNGAQEDNFMAGVKLASNMLKLIQ